MKNTKLLSFGDTLRKNNRQMTAQKFSKFRMEATELDTLRPSYGYSRFAQKPSHYDLWIAGYFLSDARLFEWCRRMEVLPLNDRSGKIETICGSMKAEDLSGIANHFTDLGCEEFFQEYYLA